MDLLPLSLERSGCLLRRIAEINTVGYIVTEMKEKKTSPKDDKNVLHNAIPHIAIKGVGVFDMWK